jgi:predicted patatin/cPLA2 family phospholipase
MKMGSFDKKKILAILTYSVFLVVAGCSLPRNPVPIAQIKNAEISGFSGVRTWEIGYKPDVQIKSDDSSGCSFLAISGGGAHGAFGAGFLCGWSESGERPNFKIVTGISTGSLIAPLAFVGSKYDERLKAGYTTTSTKDILQFLGFLQLFWGESLASSKPLTKLIAWQVDEEALKDIAKEHAKGRRLYMGTTNLDAERFMVWNMGAIASSGHPDALKLFHKVMLASASIPGAFPPVYFNVEADGKQYDEMHVDGGTITEVFGYGPSLFRDLPAAEKTRSEICSLFVIRNGKLASEPEQMRRKFISIVKRGFSTLMKAHSWEDIIRLYEVTKLDNVDFNYVGIPDGYIEHSKEPFDPKEMKRLFDMGFEMAKTGYKWRKTVPVFSDTIDDEWIWVPGQDGS